jgi:hypothetical protein
MPPPPPPLCLPFGSSSKAGPHQSGSMYDDASSYTRSFSSGSRASLPASMQKSVNDANTVYSHGEMLERHDSYSTSSTLTERAEKLSFKTDSEAYADVPPPETLDLNVLNYGPKKARKKELKEKKKQQTAKLKRPPTIASQHSHERSITSAPPPSLPPKEITKQPGLFSRIGYGWGLGKRKEVEKEQEYNRDMTTTPTTLPAYTSPSRHNSQTAPPEPIYEEEDMYDDPPPPLSRGATQRSRMTERSRMTGGSRMTEGTQHSEEAYLPAGVRTMSPEPLPVPEPLSRGATLQSHRTRRSSRADTASTLAGSAFERREHAPNARFETVDTSARLLALRDHIAREKLDF